MANRKISFDSSIGGSKTTVFKDIPDLPYLDRRIRFSLKRCNTDRYCITKLIKKEIEGLYKKLGYFEEITWRDVRQLKRESGFSIEKKEDTNNKMLLRDYPEFDTFLHFRVNGLDNPFRVFGAMKNDLCYILLLDSKGEINH